jgi:hypothetical protein
MCRNKSITSLCIAYNALGLQYAAVRSVFSKVVCGNTAATLIFSDVVLEDRNDQFWLSSCNSECQHTENLDLRGSKNHFGGRSCAG